jgi:hypothetical protein
MLFRTPGIKLLATRQATTNYAPALGLPLPERPEPELLELELELELEFDK